MSDIILAKIATVEREEHEARKQREKLLKAKRKEKWKEKQERQRQWTDKQMKDWLDENEKEERLKTEDVLQLEVNPGQREGFRETRAGQDVETSRLLGDRAEERENGFRRRQRNHQEDIPFSREDTKADNDQAGKEMRHQAWDKHKGITRDVDLFPEDQEQARAEGKSLKEKQAHKQKERQRKPSEREKRFAEFDVKRETETTECDWNNQNEKRSFEWQNDRGRLRKEKRKRSSHSRLRTEPEWYDATSTGTDGSLSPSVLCQTVTLVESRSSTNLSLPDGRMTEKTGISEQQWKDHALCIHPSYCFGNAPDNLSLFPNGRDGSKTVATQTEKGGESGTHSENNNKFSEDEDEFYDVDDSCQTENRIRWSHSRFTVTTDSEEFHEETFDEDMDTEQDSAADMDISPATHRKLGNMGLEKELGDADEVASPDVIDETRTVIAGIKRQKNNLSYSGIF